MKNILEIYKEYNIMPNLVAHQLSVAGVAMQICDALDDNVEINRDAILKACLLHDMGNIIKFKLDYFPEFLGPHGLEYWQDIQKEFIERYGNDEHVATIKIAKELGLNDRFLEILNSIGFTCALKNRDTSDFDLKIVEYADMRVGPHGVIYLHDRLKNLRIRYSENGSTLLDYKKTFLIDQREIFENALFEIEKQIFSICKINPEDINSESVAKYIEELKKFHI